MIRLRNELRGMRAPTFDQLDRLFRAEYAFYLERGDPLLAYARYGSRILKMFGVGTVMPLYRLYMRTQDPQHIVAMETRWHAHPVAREKLAWLPSPSQAFRLGPALGQLLTDAVHHLDDLPSIQTLAAIKDEVNAYCDVSPVTTFASHLRHVRDATQAMATQIESRLQTMFHDVTVATGEAVAYARDIADLTSYLRRVHTHIVAVRPVPPTFWRLTVAIVIVAVGLVLIALEAVGAGTVLIILSFLIWANVD